MLRPPSGLVPGVYFTWYLTLFSLLLSSTISADPTVSATVPVLLELQAETTLQDASSPKEGCEDYQDGYKDLGAYCSNFIAQVEDNFASACGGACMGTLRRWQGSCMYQQGTDKAREMIDNWIDNCERVVISYAPTGAPTVDPSGPPMQAVTGLPTDSPLPEATSAPQILAVPETQVPTVEPTSATSSPTDSPSLEPSRDPSFAPSDTPTIVPTEHPSAEPTKTPTRVPVTDGPTPPPTSADPTAAPSVVPTPVPTSSPSDRPTAAPTTFKPTVAPTTTPTADPTAIVTLVPTTTPAFCNHGPVAGTLHMQFGGDMTHFGDQQQGVLYNALLKALKLNKTELRVVRDAPDKKTVHLHFHFNGTQSIALGRKLEEEVEAGKFHPLPHFPLIALRMEETYCTHSPVSVQPTFAPSAAPTEPTADPTSDPTLSMAPSVSPTNCAVHEASLKIQFVRKRSSRRLLLDEQLAILFNSQRSVLHEALAKSLKLAPKELKMAVRLEADGIASVNATFSKETSPRFAEAVKRGYELEKRVLNDDFDPLPDFNVRRLVMDVKFACLDSIDDVVQTSVAPAINAAPLAPGVPASIVQPHSTILGPVTPSIPPPEATLAEPLTMDPTGACKFREAPGVSVGQMRSKTECSRVQDCRWKGSNLPGGGECAPTPCKICTRGKACGDTCIEASSTCFKPVGCAANEDGSITLPEQPALPVQLGPMSQSYGSESCISNPPATKASTLFHHCQAAFAKCTAESQTDCLGRIQCCLRAAAYPCSICGAESLVSGQQ